MKADVTFSPDGWSRRIDSANRLAYTVENGTLILLSCRGHYED